MESAGTGRLCKRCVLRRCLKVSMVGESLIASKRQNIPDCGCEVAKVSFANFSGEPWTIIDYLDYQDEVG